MRDAPGDAPDHYRRREAQVAVGRAISAADQAHDVIGRLVDRGHPAARSIDQAVAALHETRRRLDR